MAVPVEERTERWSGLVRELPRVPTVQRNGHAWGGGDHNGSGNSGRGDGQPGPRAGWPLVPAVVAAVAVGSLLTYLGMLTQIAANIAGSQLPGA